MKLTYEQKLKGYNEWKTGLKSPGIIARELSVKRLSVIYFLRLADKHGVEVLKHGKNKYYSPEELSPSSTETLKIDSLSISTRLIILNFSSGHHHRDRRCRTL